jgi:hypothetical protein
VGDNDERESIGAEGLKQTEHLQGGGAVEVSGRLVGKKEKRLVGERSGDGYPLALAAGERRGKVAGAIESLRPT